MKGCRPTRRSTLGTGVWRCGILGEGVLVIYLLNPLSTIRENDHAMHGKTHLRDIVPNFEK
jgi:hypothetical protein